MPWQDEAERAARRAGVDPALFIALVRQESGGNANAKSPAGAVGYTQLMPGTARGLGVDPYDPRQNLRGGATYLAQQLKAFGGDVRKALAAYNAGPGAVQKYGGIPPFKETQAYVQSIMSALGKGGASGKVAPAPGGGPAPLAAAPAPAGGGVDFGPAQNGAALLAQALSSQQRRPAPAGSLPAPAFAARPAMGGAVPMSSGPPAPRADVGALIDAARTQGGSVPMPGAAPGGAAFDLPASAGSAKGPVPLGGSKNAGKGSFEIVGPSPDRLRPELTSFARKVAAVYGGTLGGLDGSTHSKTTVNGNVSEHFTGNATDIFTINGKPAQGRELLRAGRAALIAAGMPRAEALKAKGGLYNVGGHQIIFLTNEGGNHFDHLHISTHARR